MAERPDPGGARDAVVFAEKLIALLDRGNFTATYKYAVLLGLIDLCLEGSTRTGEPPDSITTEQLARKVLELYWPHTSRYDPAGRILIQNQGGAAEILQLIARFRDQHAPDPSAPLSRAERHAPERFARLVRDIEWKLVEMPLPRLQRLGRRGATDDRFIYQIEWDDRIKRSTFNDPAEFHNLIRFLPGAGDHLVRLAGLLRPMIEREWALKVAQLNSLPDAELQDFLFGHARINLTPVCAPLRDLQDDQCFYCGGRLAGTAAVDHFVPWARHPSNAIENLVVTHPACNGAKSDYLAATDHVDHWHSWVTSQRTALDAIAADRQWESRPGRSLGVVRAVYLRLPAEALLWQRAGAFVPAEPTRLATILAASST